MGRPPLRKNGSPYTRTEHQRRWRKGKRKRDRETKYAEDRRQRAWVDFPEAGKPIVGDFRDAMPGIVNDASAALTTVDLPWGKKGWPLFPAIASLADAKVMPGGSLLCCIGFTDFEHALDTLRAHLPGWQFQGPLLMILTKEIRFRGKFVRIGARPVHGGAIG
jgi:hypothetical protein